LADAKSIHTQKWMTYFTKRKHEVHLISFRRADIPEVIFHPVKLSVPIRISPVARSYGKVGYLFYLEIYKRLIHQIAPDILHAHWATSYGLMGAYSAYHPFILSTWGSDVVDFPRRSYVHRKILEYTLNSADYLTATSRMLAAETQKYLSRRTQVHMIPFGVDLDRFKPEVQRAKENVTVGIAKKLEKKYGIEYLIKAFAKLAPRKQKVKLLIVGDGSQEKELKSLCRSLHIEQNVRFVGFVEHCRIPDYLNQMDVFVVPSIMSSETFGVAAVEAAACELPVIAANIGGLPEVVVDGVTGFLVPPRDAESLAEKLTVLIEDKRLRKKMGEAARKFVQERYEWEEGAGEMERLYFHALDKRGRGYK